MVLLGVVLVALGVLSMAAPYSLYAAIQAVAGVALVFHGGSQVAAYFGLPEPFRNPSFILTGVLNALLGIMFLVMPAYLTAGALVFVLAILLVFSGAERIMFARKMRAFDLASPTVSMVTGVLNVVLGIAFLFMPLMSSLVLSYMAAAYLVIGGITLLVEAATMKCL